MTSIVTTAKAIRIQNHLNEALAGQLESGEVIEGAATQGSMFLPVALPVLRALRLAPPAYLVVTNQRVLLVELRGRFPAADGKAVPAATIIEQRTRRVGEGFRFPATAKQLQEPSMSLGRINIKVEDYIFQPAIGWHFAG